jgi:GR25 family glycosyltransferase involved in LPS biosynthesis
MINSIPKFVINLDRRPDRLNKFQEEMTYMGWDFERFAAIDTNSYVGCALSYKTISQIILDRKYKYAIVFEDDIYFMPYAKSLLQDIEEQLFNTSINWDLFHFAPSIHRPLNYYNDYLLDLTNVPPKDNSKHRGIYGTSGFILTPKACEYIVEWDTNKFHHNSHQQVPIDQYLDEAVYANIQSLCGVLPIVVQRSGFSDINKTYDSNHYLMAYNWNAYCPSKLNSQMLDFNACQQLRK